MPSSTASPQTAKCSPADTRLGNSNLSAPSSLADLDPDLLRQILGFAQPIEDHHRFEWSGLIGRTCRLFHNLSRELSDVNGGVIVDLNKFHSYCSVAKARSHSRDLSVNFLSALLEKDEVARARIKELHFNPGDIGKLGRRSGDKNHKLYVKRLNKKLLPLLAALKRLLQQPNSFPNLTCLDIYRPTSCYAFELIDREQFKLLPAALPKLDHLCLGNCFAWEDCWLNESHAMEEMTDFVSSLRTPLRSLSLFGVPWMTDDHVHSLLRAIGNKLETLELVNCFRAHGPAEHDPDDKYGNEVLDLEVRQPLTYMSLNAVAKYCHWLQFFRLLDNRYAYPNETWDLVDARACDQSLELVKEANNSSLSYMYEKTYEYMYSPAEYFPGLPLFGIEKGTLYENPWAWQGSDKVCN